MVTEIHDGVDELLNRVRSQRALPPADERRRRRVDAGLSLRAFGAAVGVSWMAIDRWEKGAQPRNPAHVVAYRRLLDELQRIGEVDSD